MKYAGVLEKAYKQRKQTKKLMAQIKRLKPTDLDATVHALHEKAFGHIDCLDCGNCCQSLGPLFTHTDIKRIAKYLNMDELTFSATYLRVDEDGDTVFQAMPCPFIDDKNICSIYEVRPRACAEYPHTDRKKFHQALEITEKNALTCPAVVEILEGLKTYYLK
jgi:Fe-S-cluster containining protein